MTPNSKIERPGPEVPALRKVITKEVQHQLQEAFAYATGFGVVFIDPDGAHIGDGSNFSSFCNTINASEKGKALCYESNRRGVQMAIDTGKTSIYICHAGLVSIAVPIIVGGEYLGAITAGQVMTAAPERFNSVDANRQPTWAKKQGMAEKLSILPTLTVKQIEASALAMEKMAQYVVESYQKQQLQEDLLRHEITLQDVRRQLSEARFEALSSQVRPHFFFNVLNAVSHLLELEEIHKAKAMLDAFAKLSRYTLQNATPLVRLADEAAYIEAYLEIQAIRFEEFLSYSLELEAEAENVQIPFFSLQPFVENALEHGIFGARDKGRIQISVRAKSDHICLDIRDDGRGMSADELLTLQKICQAEQKPREHFGIRNCYQRFRAVYGERFSLTIFSLPEQGTHIRICLFEDEAQPPFLEVISGLPHR